MPILGGNSDDLVPILSRMGIVVLVLLLLLINFTWHEKKKRKIQAGVLLIFPGKPPLIAKVFFHD